MANTWFGSRLTKEDWSGILYALMILNEIHTSGGIVLTGSKVLNNVRLYLAAMSSLKLF